MTSESNRISAASVSYIDSVCRAWGWSWSEIGQADDDGLDGLVYIRTMQVNPKKPADRRSWKHNFTGGVISLQIKSGSSYVVRQNEDQLEISIPNLNAKKELWMRSPLPVALVYVKEEPLGKIPNKAWWVDLKSAQTYSEDTIIVPLKNRFQAGIECRPLFARLANAQHRRLSLPTIDMTATSQLPARINSMSLGVKRAGIEFYKQWKSSGAVNPEFGEIIINRTGWSHITRVERPVSRIMTSLELLPAAARIVSEASAWRVLKRGDTPRYFKDGSWAIFEYIGLSAMVKWPARGSSEVMVILRRQTTFTNENTIRVIDRKTWFYSVYEPSRRK